MWLEGDGREGERPGSALLATLALVSFSPPLGGGSH